jgi:hypothetical protein
MSRSNVAGTPPPRSTSDDPLAEIELPNGTTAALRSAGSDVQLNDSRQTLHEETPQNGEHEVTLKRRSSEFSETTSKVQTSQPSSNSTFKSTLTNMKSNSKEAIALKASALNAPSGKSGDFEYEDDADDALKRCGCGSFRPDWLQRFRTPIVFLINYSLMGILRGAYFHYTISSLSTIEKRYAFPSRLSSIILIADNVSSMIINPLVGYLGLNEHFIVF